MASASSRLRPGLLGELRVIAQVLLQMVEDRLHPLPDGGQLGRFPGGLKVLQAPVWPEHGGQSLAITIEELNRTAELFTVL